MKNYKKILSLLIISVGVLVIIFSLGVIYKTQVKEREINIDYTKIIEKFIGEIPSGYFNTSPNPFERNEDLFTYCLSGNDTVLYAFFVLMISDSRELEDTETFLITFDGETPEIVDDSLCNPIIRSSNEVYSACYKFEKDKTYLAKGVFVKNLAKAINMTRDIFEYNFDIKYYGEHGWECAGAGIHPNISW